MSGDEADQPLSRGGHDDRSRRERIGGTLLAAHVSTDAIHPVTFGAPLARTDRGQLGHVGRHGVAYPDRGVVHSGLTRLPDRNYGQAALTLGAPDERAP